MRFSDNSQMLRTNQQYRRVYDQGRKFHTPFFTAFFMRSETRLQRFGITVTKKIGGAVIRNRCKRRIREVIRRYYLQETTAGIPEIGFDMVINVKSAAIRAEFAELQEAFASALQRCLESTVESDQTVPLR
ncbi:MAG: ribonuclease P protein component [Acidobacteriota bacterium]|nr:MAG: ribonuclease P protein component [Acidobacteriota bacterium]